MWHLILITSVPTVKCSFPLMADYLAYGTHLCILYLALSPSSADVAYAYPSLTTWIYI